MTAAAVLSLSACGSSPRAAAAEASAGLDPAAAAAGAEARSEDGPAAATGAAGPITVAVAGDVHFEGSSAAALEPGALAAVAGVLSAADVSVVNLETAVTGRGTPAPKRYTFRAPPTALAALEQAGVDVVAMANNHSLDYGPVGLRDTLAASRTEGLPVIGVGEDADAAYAPWTTTVRGHDLAVFNATQVLDASLATAWTATTAQGGVASVKTDAGRRRLLTGVHEAHERGASVVVVLHWGAERDSCPSPAQESLADDLVAAGADAVVGSHAHQLLGAGWKRAGGRSGYVDYGLGNFVFYARGGVAARTGVLTLTLPGRTTPAPAGTGAATGGRAAPGARWQPAAIRSGVPVPLTGAAAEGAVAEKDALRSCTDLGARPS
ncbi:poly-gamma-glutamate synthesis protein (capsule biosynthesis protein) [Kineococcus radiotolerans]|uniref:Poly-gamma-glutamate synthesis protein (Capsule biosynthesis protein) n=1 Tax=Kineococcus radiotolerans TaxID=131568 RepID=A0A7W4TJH5_KINRA|nr:CapA family protein [Kineococcus radiotolerans]MBB2899456.1 poly-gamma-glutamate synthesis protein (capsule biosynthesis protein) [Kineococcus radiotolerans]